MKTMRGFGVTMVLASMSLGIAACASHSSRRDLGAKKAMVYTYEGGRISQVSYVGTDYDKEVWQVSDEGRDWIEVRDRAGNIVRFSAPYDVVIAE